MRFIKYIFTPNYGKYEGVRPVNIYLLRMFFLLMFIGPGMEMWSKLLSAPGPFDHTKAVAYCVWAAYPTLGLLGLLKPLRWLPIMIFMLFYKTLWLIFVAYPLWQSNTLAGSPAEEMAYVFLLIPLPALAVPWIYVFKTYVWLRQEQ